MPLTQQQQEQRLLLGHEGFYFTGGESLRITSLNSITGVTVIGAGRFLPVSELRPTDVAFSHTPNTDRSSASSDFIMGEGWLQSLTLIASGGTPVAGATHVRVDVVRGSGASSTVLATLIAGFVTAGTRLAWPGSAIVDPVAGRGRIRAIVGSNPAAGAIIIETVPTGARWRLISVRFELVTDATVATREVVFTCDDGSNAYFRSGRNGTQAASLTMVYVASTAGWLGSYAGNNHHAPIPNDLIMPAGHRFYTTTTNLQAGDEYGSPLYIVEEWLEP